MQKKIGSLIVLFIFTIFGVNGQFTVTGDAAVTTCNCVEVTADLASENGSFYNPTSIDLNDAFDFKFTVNFGCEGTGGEGLAFVLQNAGWGTGAGGYGIGYEGISGNSLSVEFDTRDNEASGEIMNSDVPGDHISLQDNGDIDHAAANPNNLLGTPSGLNAGEDATPHNIKPGFPNLEDCEDHLVQIIWTPGTNQTIQIKIDNITTLTYIGDMIADQFGGNPTVLWGWTGSTGVFSNVQTVCTALVPAFTFTPTNCPGEVINFSDASCSFYPLTDWDWDFAGLGTSTGTSASYTFDDAGSYVVELNITDDQGCDNTVSVEVPIGFETETSTDDAIVCPDGTTLLHAEGNPFEATECCFKLVLNDLWGDYWGSGVANELEILVDGTSFGFYTPTSFDPGAGTSDTIDLCFDQDAALEFVIHGTDSPAECSYYFLDNDLTEIVSVNGAVAGTWTEGATETHTVDCGLTPPSYEYLWDNAGLLSDETSSDPTATVPSDTWFHVEITDPSTGCTITDSIQVTTHPPVTAVLTGMSTICAGDNGDLYITFTGTAPYDVDITGPSGPLPTITGIMSSPYTLSVGEDGDYTISAVTGSGCVGTFSGSGSITVITPFDVSIASSATYCDGETISDLIVTDTDGGAINWYNDPGLGTSIGMGTVFTPPSVIGSVTYYATETEDVLGCSGAAAEVTITVNPIPPAPTFTGTTAYCEGDAATDLFGEASLGGTITWYDGPLPGGTALATSTSFTPPLAAPGIVLYITETAAGCEGPATEILITVNPTPPAPIVTGDTEYCEGETPTNLTSNPVLGGVIEWRDLSGTLLSTGTNYTPTLTVGGTTIEVFEVLGGCISEATTVEINVQAAPTVTIPEMLTICYGDSILVTAENNGYDISWSDGQLGMTVWLGPEMTTNYIVTATNPACGSATDDLTLIVNELPDITTSNDTIIGIGGEVNMWAYSEDANTFSWSPSVYQCETDDCSSVYDVPDRATVYVVTITDNNGCTNSDTIVVDINGIMEVFVPNIFSPNGDGSNDNLVIYGPRLFDFSIEIYDRWGKKVFESKEQKETWDGKFNDKQLAPQTFVYIITGKTVLGESVKKEGNVTILR